MLHVAFLRSEHAHARLKRIDVSAARRRPGVVAVYTAADLGDYWRPGPLLVPPPPIPGLEFHACTQVPPVKDKSRHVGEPIAMVVAESRYVAEDALADITLDVEPLAAVVDLEAALSRGAPLVHEQLKSNRAAHVIQKKGDYDAARAAAHKVITRRFLHDSGAYDSYGLTVPINSQCTLLGPYDVPSYYTEFTAVFTNKTLVTPVRGAGRQHGVFVMERLLDFAARALGLDRLEIRRRNY